MWMFTKYSFHVFLKVLSYGFPPKNTVARKTQEMNMGTQQQFDVVSHARIQREAFIIRASKKGTHLESPCTWDSLTWKG